MKKTLKRRLSVIVVIALIFNFMYVGLGEDGFGGLFTVKAEAATFDEINANNVFVKQGAGTVTCTLCASVNMLRRVSMLRGDANWATITESSAKSSAWISGTGLRGTFSYSDSANGIENISVTCSTLPGNSSNTSTLINLLASHPEGIVIYNGVHAVLLTDYTDGVFYCNDPDDEQPVGRVTASRAYSVKPENATQYWYVSSPSVTLNDYADVGDEFYAVILNTAHWKPITVNSDASVTLEKELGAAKQLWYFDRQDDGSYVITSTYTGNALEMDCGNTTSGNPVVCKEYWGGNYQKWWIYRQGDGYVFVSKHYPEYNLAITLSNNSSTDGTKITTSTRCNDSSQIFSVYGGNDVQLKPATLSVSPGNSATNTTFSWNDVYGENWYDLKIWKDQLQVGEAFHIEWGANSGYSIQLPAGTYYAYVDALNYYQCQMSNVVTFTVSEKTYSVTYNANGGTGAPSSQTKTYGQTLTLSSTVPTRSDYTFLGWATDPNATTVEYAPGDEYTLNQDLTLYALWTLSHVHNHSYEIIQSPTCTENGVGKYTCACGDEYTAEVPATGHQNTMWITEAEPTCTVDGYKDCYCLDCAELIGTEAITATGHQNTTWLTEQQPTCDVAGSKYEYCLNCREKIKIEEIPATGHSYSTEWTIDVVATCTEEGSKSHHCVICGDITDVTVIEVLGHDYVVAFTEEEHPHTISYKCSRCTETKQETSTSTSCALCNFTYTNVDDSTCKITGYVGTANSFVVPGTIDGRTVTTTTTGAFKNNTTLTFVKIENGVQGLGSLAFLGCSSLSKVVIPESVTSIGANAFYNCASDFTIYCYRDSYAMQYAIDNSLNYIVMDIGETEKCTIDYENKMIFLSAYCIKNLADAIYIPATSEAFAEASFISGNNEFLGTGSIVTVFDADTFSEYTIVVSGDTNGDSVCDALDAWQVGLASNGHETLDGAYAMAADSNSDDVVDITDYQTIVNKAVA